MPLPGGTSGTEQKYFNNSQVVVTSKILKLNLPNSIARKCSCNLLQITTSGDFRQCTQKLIFSDRFSFCYPPGTRNLLKYLMDFTEISRRIIKHALEFFITYSMYCWLLINKSATAAWESFWLSADTQWFVKTSFTYRFSSLEKEVHPIMFKLDKIGLHCVSSPF